MEPRRRRSLLLGLVPLVLVTLASGGCRAKMVQAAEEPVPPTAPGWVDTSPHLPEDVYLDGLHIKYLDWGGIGPALVMIHGLGGNPHVFDDLAPLLRDHFHVIAYALRGHGDSDAPARGPYDLKALVGDLGRFLDRLRIDRANLLAWSTSADQATSFAVQSPERVGKIVYLEGAYDWSDATFLDEFGKMVAANVPSAADNASPEAYRAWFTSTWLGAGVPWTTGLEAYVRDKVRIGEDGRITQRAAAGVQKQLFAALAAEPPQDYAHVRAPALALYATSFFPAVSANPGRSWLASDFEQRVAAPFRAASMARVQRDLGGVTVRTVDGTTHMSIGVSGVEALAATINGFLVNGGSTNDAGVAPAAQRSSTMLTPSPPWRRSPGAQRATYGDSAR
jgi:pimeloyl-ACP methyl ester carboxylesterase